MTVAGSLALMESGTVTGGLDVSGGSHEQDRQVAETATHTAGIDAHP